MKYTKTFIEDNIKTILDKVNAHTEYKYIDFRLTGSTHVFELMLYSEFSGLRIIIENDKIYCVGLPDEIRIDLDKLLKRNFNIKEILK